MVFFWIATSEDMILEGWEWYKMKLANPLSLFAAGAANSENINSVTVIIIGMVVVLVALIVLTAVFWAFGKIMARGNKPAKPTADKSGEVFKPVAAPVPVPISTVQSGISDEVVAVIAAAVASMAPEGKKYAVRSVSRTRTERPVWAAAGIAESTRPF
jgi:sodium pump decarboxylase gamma subunit